ncbi:hypothetical protein ACLI1A_08515 [Flavobacterium sp. RHBU_3]|uniref:hypothetical protein n=1 Tax=Flavobacterium sp. RHBU_3 TaxID=3391184 RepID=UPI00398505D9
MSIKLYFPLKPLVIPDVWKVYKNDFTVLEPDNNYPIDDVFYYFIDDLLQATYNGYCIDLGFNGEYLDNRDGNFKLVVLKGDFLDGEVLETFTSRKTEEIKKKLDYYFEMIPHL